ncbi:MAG: VWA domain-containing protein, partial [Firmicutes bacterium]|nr:VWA domain-containing protein [Bacillota bacterium]
MLSKYFKHGLALILCLSLVLGAFSPAFAEEAEPEWTISKSKTASEYELDPTQKQTEVTLSLPAGEFLNKVDVVFVNDSSSSTDLGTVFIDAALGLLDDIVEKNPNVDLKVGVILFTGRANDAIDYVSDGDYTELVPYNDDTKDYVEDSFKIMDALTEEYGDKAKEQFRTRFGRGSNPHGGLDIADEWLTADEDVPDTNKYVILFSDGKGYIWNDDENVPTTIYSQIYKRNTDTKNVNNVGVKDAVSCVYNSGKVSLDQSMGYNLGSYSLDVLDPTNHSNIIFYDDYEDLYDSDDDELTGVNDWDAICYYAIDTTTPAGDVEKHPTTNGTDIFGTGTNYAYWFEWKPEEKWKDIPYLQMNPYEVVEETVEGENGPEKVYSFNTNKINSLYYQYHFSNLYKGLYKAGHLWTEMNDKYNCAAVTYDSSTGGGLEIVGPFKTWLRANSKYSAQKSEASQIGAMFDGIDNDIRFLLGRGVVIDPIAPELDLVIEEGVCPFTLTVGGELFEAVQGSAANTWDYNSEGKTLYCVTWDEEEKVITWEINVPVDSNVPVTLSYTLEWNGSGERDTDTPTNGTTTLEYWKSTNTGNTSDGIEEFEAPDVIYNDA